MQFIRRWGKVLLRIFRQPLPGNECPLVCRGYLPKRIRRRLEKRDAVGFRRRFRRRLSNERIGVS